jgi:nicotinamidase-related amidase
MLLEGGSVRDAFQHDFHTITLSDCCAEYHSEHEAALETLGRVVGRVCTLEDVVAARQTWRIPVAADGVEQTHK